ncbi:hypothetical protein ACFY4B_36395 [Kitasatospora sp. NPDC001261]|uniref:hypothetical protein n=1 Tax=Kitasatospora sp. NPDC001261 TaxID=3364012 RepID=UPI00367C1C6D
MIADLSMNDAMRWLNKELATAGFRAWEVVKDGRYRQVTEGTGWCQAAGVWPECWPPGVLGCLRVIWTPDPAYQRDDRTGRIPAGAAEHWQESTGALLAAVRALGLGAALTGPHRTPERFTSAELLVWEPGLETPAEWPPPGAWEGVPPTRPNWVDGWHRWGSDPREELAWALRQVRKARKAEGRRTIGKVSAGDLDGVLWPPGAHARARVLWHPEPPHERGAGGLLPEAAATHWHDGIAQLRDDLTSLGYQSRTAWGHRAARRTNFAVVLAWRGALPAART